MTGTIRIGIAGWNFVPWRGEFYPEGLPQKQELDYASRALRTIEINATFYRHQKPASFAAWAAATPETFRFSVKGHQLVTHLKKLRDVEIPLANFFGSGVLALGDRLGPFVWQLPGNLGFEAGRLEAFLDLLPKAPDALINLAARADERLGHAPYLELEGIAGIRHALEVRHRGFADPAVLKLLEKHNVALVTADTAEWPTMDITADFAYLRLQGAPGADRYSEAELDRWADRLRALAEGQPVPGGTWLGAAPSDGRARDVFAYFVSTDKVHAPANAVALMRRLGLAPPG
jgi:uncharacterized protein YecE (DUF72 family)